MVVKGKKKYSRKKDKGIKKDKKKYTRKKGKVLKKDKKQIPRYSSLNRYF